MAAPEHVPSTVAEQPRIYQSPPRRPDPWVNDRPGDFDGPQPVGPGLGAPGPDQGYALKLARRYEGQLSLAAGEHEADAISGAMAVAMKRASLFGRAPMIHDLTLAFAVWGYLGEGDAELVALRTRMFEEVHHPHHYLERRAIADAVPEQALRMTPAQVRLQMATDWRPLISVDIATGVEAPIIAGEPEPVPFAAAPPPMLVADAAVVEDIEIEATVIEPAAVQPVLDAPPLPVRGPEPAVASGPTSPDRAGTADDVTVERQPEPLVEPEPIVEPEPEPVAKALGPEQSPPPQQPPPPQSDTPPAKRKPVKPVPLDPEEVARLARQARVAFQKQSHHPKPPEGA